MSDRNDLFLLEDMLDAIQKLFNYTDGISFDAYLQHDMLQDAVERNFEIIGEAASRLSDDCKTRNPKVDWRVLKDFRNVIIHKYFDVRQEILWNIIQYDLKEMQQHIQMVYSIEKNNTSTSFE